MNEIKNPIGGKSQIKLRNVRDFLSDSEKICLQSLLSNTKTKVGALVHQICSDNIDASMDLEYEFSIADITGKDIHIKPAVEEIFLPIYIAKDMRAMNGGEALSLAEKHLKVVSTTVFSVLMRQATHYGDFRVRERVLSFIQKATQYTGLNIGNTKFQAQLENFRHEIEILNPQKPGKITHDKAQFLINNLRGVRGNYINIKAILNQTRINLWVCFQLLEAMRNDISYRYASVDFQSILEWYEKQKNSLTISYQQRFLYAIRHPKFYKKLIQDFGVQYPWIVNQKTKQSPSKLSLKSAKTVQDDNLTRLITESRNAGISPELLRIARHNAANSYFNGSGGGKSSKKSRRIGHE